MARPALALGLVLVWLTAVPAAADDRPRLARIGILGPSEEPRFSQMAAGLRQGLAELGHPVGTIELLEGRIRRGDSEGARTAVEGFTRQRVKVLFVIGSVLTQSARQVTADLPIVFITPGDPVAAGIVTSFARPGGHTTGMTFEFPELAGKRLEILKEMAPRIRRVLALFDPRDASPRQNMEAARAAAPRLGLVLVEREARSREELLRGLETLRDVDAVLGIPGGFPSGHHEEIIRRAHARRRPTMFYTRTAGAEDAVATYGASDVTTARQAARLVDKILKGAEAGDLPIERPTTLEFIINAKSAKALGVTIPPALLYRVDRVIE